MASQLHLALIQTDIVWHDAASNREVYTQKIATIKEGTDLVLLPEMCTTGFSMKPERIAEAMDGKTVTWLRELSKSKQLAIGGSFVIEEEGHYYNRFLLATPEGRLETYDKRHLFTLAGEEKVYTQGDHKKLMELKGWTLCPMICYDLRFPVWARNTEDYDVLIYVANWPKPRIMAWDTLLKARAMENMCYTIGVNRVGGDDNKLKYVGHTAAYDSLGAPLTPLAHDEETIHYVTLDKDHLSTTRGKLGFLADRDAFQMSL
jgi:predicted amidohydrolase